MYSTQRGTPGGKKGRLLRRICRLAGVTLLVSVVAIVIGVISVIMSGPDFPYSAGGAMIAGIPAFILAFCPFCMFYEARKTGDSDYDTTGCFDCCTILMIIWFSITILAIPVAFGMSGIYGVAACLNEVEKAKVCEDNAGAKFALSLMTIFVTIVLFVLTLAIFFTCCCNSATFGMPICDTDSDTSDRYFTTRDLHGPIRYNWHENRQGRAVQSTFSESGPQEFRPRPATIGSENIERDIIQPSAPRIGGDSDILPSEDFYIDTGQLPSYRSSANQYVDPPPSYEEVMKKESTETPL